MTTTHAPARKPTPKQTLFEHITTMHVTQAARSRVQRHQWTFTEMSRWHANQHHRLTPNHIHAGPNTGPDDRPIGWYTGQDAVLKHQPIDTTDERYLRLVACARVFIADPAQQPLTVTPEVLAMAAMRNEKLATRLLTGFQG